MITLSCIGEAMIDPKQHETPFQKDQRIIRELLAKVEQLRTDGFALLDKKNAEIERLLQDLARLRANEKAQQEGMFSIIAAGEKLRAERDELLTRLATQCDMTLAARSERDELLAMLKRLRAGAVPIDEVDAAIAKAEGK
jgi:hypothetical protein